MSRTDRGLGPGGLRSYWRRRNSFLVFGGESGGIGDAECTDGSCISLFLLFSFPSVVDAVVLFPSVVDAVVLRARGNPPPSTPSPAALLGGWRGRALDCL
jgi:hypothetical protein